MTIKEKPKHRKQVIDLSGPEGNAYYLLGLAKKYANQLGKDDEAIINEMKSGDYENLITVFDREFGDYIDLER